MLRFVLSLAIAGALTLVGAPDVFAQEIRINVHADQVRHKISRYLTGACLEDVNHEVYGGIDSQMIFGESFQEPPHNPPRGFRVLGGRWHARDGELIVVGIPGDKLISDLPAFDNGEVGVEVFMTPQTTNAGLIVRVQNATAGMDTFDGYEISLNAVSQYVLLGRHRHNWEHIVNTPCDIPANAWVRLSVKLQGNTLEIFVNDRSVVRHMDDNRALLSGTVGLRQFQRDAKYRKLWIKTGKGLDHFDFTSPDNPSGDVSGMWRAVRSGKAEGSLTIQTERPFIGQQSQRMTFTSGEGAIGVENQGLNRWGLYLVEGRPYEGLLWVRAEKPTEISVGLQDREGQRTLAETTLQVTSPEWQRLPFTLTPNATVNPGRFSILLKQPGDVVLGYAFLQPGDWGRFKGLPVRRDVAEGLIAQGNTVLRYGGSMINHAEYRWKKIIGPRDRRPPCNGTWYPYSSNGWGILDFLDFCEAAGFLAIPAFNVNESPEDMADFMEYLHGPATSRWGQVRANSNHPAPYRLQFIELGNEERVDEAYFTKFKPLAETIWSRDPDITIVVGDFVYSQNISNPDQFGGAASGITNLNAHRKILQLAKQHQREVWFDLHVGTDGPRPDSTLAATLSFRDALDKIADGAQFKVAVFELNSGNHTQRRALANAIAIQTFARDGRIPVVTSANCLQPDGQNDNDWNQGLLFLNPAQVWSQPPGFVTELFAKHLQTEVVTTEVADAGNHLDVLATRDAAGRRLVLQVVNPTEGFAESQIHLSGFKPKKTSAEAWELSGPLESRNTATQPTAIIPQRHDWVWGSKLPHTYNFPPHSITILNIE